MTNNVSAALDTLPTQAIQVVAQPGGIERRDPDPEMSVDDLVRRVKKVHEVQAKVMQDGHHYGKIPGVDKPALLKPGAELLGLTFRLDPQFDVIEQIRSDDGHLTVVIKCTLYHAPSSARMGSGLGSCSTRESKYAYRKSERLCPKCGKATIIKGKEEYGGGWLCYGKKGGCGAKFKVGDQAIEGQQVGRVPNEDIADQYNTVLKMAVKRAHVAAILFVTCASDIFTQDVEDGPETDEPPPRKPGSGTPVKTNVSPHLEPDEEPDAGFDHNADSDALYARLMRELHELEENIAQCANYDEALLLRRSLGSKKDRSNLTMEIQRAREDRVISPDQYHELGRKWQRCDRQLQKQQERLKPDAAASFTDPDPERDGNYGHDEMGKPL